MAEQKKFFFEMTIHGEIEDVQTEEQAELVVRNAISIATRIETWDTSLYVGELRDDVPRPKMPDEEEDE